MPLLICRRWLTLFAILASLHGTHAVCATVVVAGDDKTNADIFAEPPAPEAPPFFGPNHEPLRFIDIPPGFEISYGYSINGPFDVQGDQAFVVGTIEQANVWALLVWFWPEFLLALIVLITLPLAWSLRRAIKRPQVTGEPCCRQCNYRLTGSTANDCPECGLKLSAHQRNRVAGKHRRVKPRAIALLALLCIGGFVGFKWYPPDNAIGYGYSSNLPREGVVSTWFDWPSRSALEWVNEHVTDTAWTEHLEATHGQLWRIDLNTGTFAECMYDYKLGETPAYVPPNLRLEGTTTDDPFIHRIGHLRVLTTGIERHLFDAQRGIYATLPGNNWDMVYFDMPPGLRWSPDGRYLFDSSTFKTPVIWDTTTWQKVATCPDIIHDEKFTPDIVEINTIRLIPDSLSTVVEATTASPSPLLERVFIWDPQTNDTRELPETLIHHGVYFVAMTHDERYLVAEQSPETPYPLIWDTKRLAAGDDEPLDVPWTKFGDEAGTWRTFIAAIARKGHVVYLYNDRYFAWHLDTGELKPMTQPPADADVHWISKPPRPMPDPFISQDGLEIEIDSYTDDEPHTIRTPVTVEPPFAIGFFDENTLAGPDRRLLHGHVANAVVVYDIKTKKWIGRFNLPADTRSVYTCAQINEAGTQMAVLTPVGDESMRMYVFALPPLE